MKAAGTSSKATGSTVAAARISRTPSDAVVGAGGDAKVQEDAAKTASSKRVPQPSSSVTVTPVTMADTSSREYLDRQSWSWVDGVLDPDRDISERDVAHAYRLHYVAHVPMVSNCKRNCKYNPRCYMGLGLEDWIGETTDSDDEEEELMLDGSGVGENGDLSSSGCPARRDPSLPAGLKNLGNTCYVNSFLQIWFHNASFRQALYEWDPGLDAEERENESLLKAELYEPRGKVASLQALFAMMEFTNRRAVDPNDFITKLGLDPQVQQDAQEFSKLFMSLLESSLATQKCESVRSVVQGQFRGRYAYVTACCSCKRESERPSDFYELDLTLQGNKTLSDCLADYLKEEKLEGDNQYFCEGCDAKRDAVRCVRLRELPPVLNLQLNRFIFDMQTGRKKKLNSSVQFPERLDLSSYLRQKEGTTVYALTGVLMHVGAQASHGHYLAHIQDHSGQWYKFSDTAVDRLAGKNPKLGAESDPMESMPGVSKKGKSTTSSSSSGGKGTQTSNNAYMLVYTEQNTLAKIRRQEEEKQRQRTRVLEEGRRVGGGSVPTPAAAAAAVKAEEEPAKTPATASEPASNGGASGRKRGPGRPPRRGRKGGRGVATATAADSPASSEPSEGDEMKDLSDVAASAAASEFEYVNGQVYPRHFPMHLRAYIEQDRQQLEDEVREAVDAKMEKFEERRTLKRKMSVVCGEMMATAWSPEDVEDVDVETDDDEEEAAMAERAAQKERERFACSEFIPTDWLHKFFRCPAGVPTIDTSSYQCVHGKMDLDKLNDVKVVNCDVADRLYEESGTCEVMSSPRHRLNRRSLCRVCVKNRCRKMQLERVSAADDKAVREMVKKPLGEDDEDAFWVGKASLKNWRKKAVQRLETQIGEEIAAALAAQEEEELEEQAMLAALGEEEDDGDEDDEDDDDDDEEIDYHDCSSPTSAHSLAESTCSTASSSNDNRNLDLEEVKSKLSRVGTNISFVKVPPGAADRPKKEAETKKKPSGLLVIKKFSETKNVSISSRGKSEMAKTEKQEEEVDKGRFRPIAPASPAGKKSEPGPRARSPTIVTLGRGRGRPPRTPVNNGGTPTTTRRPMPASRRRLECGPHQKRRNRDEEMEMVVDADDEEEGADDDEADDERARLPRRASPMKENGYAVSAKKAKLEEEEDDDEDVKFNKAVINGTASSASSKAVSSSTPLRNKASNGFPLPSSLSSSAAPTPQLPSPVMAAGESFNDDIVCRHGNLSPHERARRLVSGEVWRKLKEYFPRAKDFRRDQETCRECRDQQSVTAHEVEARKELAAKQKSALIDVFNERNRPSWAKANLNKVHLISRSFVQEWRQFVRAPQHKQPVTSLGNQVLLCEHGGLLYPLGLDTESDYESTDFSSDEAGLSVFMVSEEEWTHIESFFTVDDDIVVTRADATSASDDLFVSSPAVCRDCVRRRHEREEQERLCYKNVPVYIRQLTGGEKVPPAAGANGSKHPPGHDPSDPDFLSPVAVPTVSSSSSAPTPSSSSAEETSKVAPGVNRPGTPAVSAPASANHVLTNGGSKRQKLSANGNSGGGEQTTTPSLPPFNGDALSSSVRRSNRRQKVRGDREVTVSSDMLLRDLKVKIMEHFKVAPFDQHLHLDGCQLAENNKTLAELRVMPRSVIYLRADQPMSSAAVGANGEVVGANGIGAGADEAWVASHPEEGFKGTGLLSGF